MEKLNFDRYEGTQASTDWEEFHGSDADVAQDVIIDRATTAKVRELKQEQLAAQHVNFNLIG